MGGFRCVLLMNVGLFWYLKCFSSTFYLHSLSVVAQASASLPISCGTELRAGFERTKLSRGKSAVPHCLPAGLCASAHPNQLFSLPFLLLFLP